MRLDIHTKRGQVTVEQELRAADIIEHYFECDYLTTPRADARAIAAVDAVLAESGSILGIAETKCRNMSLRELHGRFDHEWLVTYQKLLDGVVIAGGLQVDFWGFLYLVPEDAVLVTKLWSPARLPNDWLVPVRTQVTATQATVNGGTAHRENAFIDMRDAVVLKW